MGDYLYKYGDSYNHIIKYRLKRSRLLPLLIPAIMFYSGTISAGQASIQPQESIIKEVKSFIAKGIRKQFPHHKITVSKLDPRLSLALCDVPLNSFLPPGGQLIGNTSVGVSCNGRNPWTIYVPTSIKAMRKVVVTTHPVLRNTTLSPNDIRLEERDITTSPDAYIFNTENVVGKIIKRSLTTSTVLTPNMLSAPLLVHRGQQVIIMAEEEGIQVRMTGTALMDGAEGQIIRVQNKHSKRKVEGQVIQPGVIKVNM